MKIDWSANLKISLGKDKEKTKGKRGIGWRPNRRRRKTAVITGATSGIGREFARACAQKGYRLILVGRREERLEKLAHELTVPCQIVVADFCCEDQVLQFWALLEKKPVDLFLNNAGFGLCGDFVETSLKTEQEMLEVNVRAMHILFKSMVMKMEKQGYGVILNVGSAAGLLPAGPHMASYYATKAYVVSLTRAVARELKEKGSRVQVAVLCPGPVDTEFNERAQVKFALKGISPEYCVKEAMRGLRWHRTVIVPSPQISLGIFAQRFLPDCALIPLVSRQQKRKTNR